MTEQVNKNHVDMDKWLTDNNITEVECLVPDLTGVARGKILPREKFSTDRAMRLPEAVFGMTVTGESPEGYEGYDLSLIHICYSPRQPNVVRCHASFV